LVAVAALVRYTNNQAYFILQHLDTSLAEKAVTVSAPDNENPLDMRIDAIFVRIIFKATRSILKNHSD